MRVKKAIAVLLASSMVLGITGCKKSDTDVSKKEQSGGSVTEATKKEEANGESTEKSTEKEFSYWLSIHAMTAKAMTSHNEHPAAKRLEEQTGVKVTYINPPVGQEKENMNLLLASGKNLPDLMRFDFKKNYRGGVSAAIADGIIIDATKLIEENAPNFMKRINEDEDLRKGAYTDDGVLAYFGAIVPDKEMRGRPFMGPMVNKTLLDKAGLKVPETIADWEVMLATFKDMGVLPFSFGCFNKFSGLYGAFSSAYGVPAGAIFMNQDGTVKFGPMEPGYKEFLTLFHKWYENGWLDPDFLSKNQNKEIRNDFDAGMMGASVLHVNSVITAPITSVKQGNEEAVAVPAPYPILNKGDKTHFTHYVTNYNNVPCYISKTAKDPLTIVKWVDYLYSPEGITEISWGVKDDDRYDDTYYIDENGKKQYTDYIAHNPDGLAPEEMYRIKMLRDTAMVWDWENQSLMYDDKRQQDCWSVWSTNADHKWCMPNELTMTAEENDEYSRLMGDIETYVNEMSSKYIMGIESLDNYDQFIKTLENMQVKRVIEIQQGALDRYMSR